MQDEDKPRQLRLWAYGRALEFTHECLNYPAGLPGLRGTPYAWTGGDIGPTHGEEAWRRWIFKGSSAWDRELVEAQLLHTYPQLRSLELGPECSDEPPPPPPPPPPPRRAPGTEALEELLDRYYQLTCEPPVFEWVRTVYPSGRPRPLRLMVGTIQLAWQHFLNIASPLDIVHATGAIRQQLDAAARELGHEPEGRAPETRRPSESTTDAPTSVKRARKGKLGTCDEAIEKVRRLLDELIADPDASVSRGAVASRLDIDSDTLTNLEKRCPDFDFEAERRAAERRAIPK
jgi:hypothetical protein